MAFCPKCKSEYVDGITVCVDCGCALVDTLQEEKKSAYLTNEAVLMAAVSEQIRKEAAAELLKAAEAERAMQQEAEEAFQEEEDEAPQKAKGLYRGRYVNSEEKAEDNRTSAYTLLLVGGIGLVLVVLFFFEVLPLHIYSGNKYMVSLVMGGLFLLFVIMGVVSYKNSKELKGKAQKEKDLAKEIRDWYLQNMTGEQIDRMIPFADDMEEESKYFQRAEVIRDMIGRQYPDLEEGYADSLIDEIYSILFEEQEI